jgi:hypothetical protein
MLFPIPFAQDGFARRFSVFDASSAIPLRSSPIKLSDYPIAFSASFTTADLHPLQQAVI